MYGFKVLFEHKRELVKLRAGADGTVQEEEGRF